MIQSANTESRPGLSFDPRTKIILLILCVISAMIVPSLSYENLLVFAITIFGCASGKVRKSLVPAAFYGVFYLLTTRIMSLEKGLFYTVFTSWLGLFYTVYPCAFLANIILSTTKVNEFLTAMNKAHIPKQLVIPLAVMLRYIPTVCEDWGYIKDAMRLRDVTPSLFGFLKNPVMTVECLYVPLLMAASNAADELSAAAVTRGIENPTPRTCLLEIRFRGRDRIATVLATCIFVLGLIWERIVSP